MPHTLRAFTLTILALVAATTMVASGVGEHVTVDEPMPKFSAQYDYFGGGRGAPQQPYGGGSYGNPYGGMSGGDTVNFDFQCKCQAKSALARTLSTPITDPNQQTQQHIQQLQEQVRKLQEQINKSQQSKSSFEQFTQMLASADGLDCNCSGSSTPWTGWPSGVFGGSGLGGGGGGGFGGFPPRGGGQMPRGGMPMGGGPFAGGHQPFQAGGHPLYGPMMARQA